MGPLQMSLFNQKSSARNLSQLYQVYLLSEFHADKPDHDKDEEDSNEDSDKEEEMDEDVE